jgi:hypothetical protein
VDRDGRLTNDKFCFIRNGKLKLNWWRKPLKKREIADQQRNCTLQKTEMISGVCDEATPVENSAAGDSQRKRTEKVGSSLSVPPEMGSRDSHSGTGGTK